VTTLARVRKIALGLPETTEQDHHGMISFRVRGKIFSFRRSSQVVEKRGYHSPRVGRGAKWFGDG